MFLIGIIDNKKDSKFEREIKSINRNIKTIRINQDNLLQANNYKFNLIILEKNLRDVEKIINRSDYLILNDSISLNLTLEMENKVKIITYGFKNKSTVTVSSADEDKIVLSIQRTFFTYKRKEIYPQDIIIERKHKFSINKYVILRLLHILLEN